MTRSILDAMNWRAAVKKFQPKPLLEEHLQLLLETLRLAPSSYGLQPWKFIFVTNPEVRAQLRAAGYGQAQITDASALIVFAARTDFGDTFVDEFISSIAEVRGVEKETLNDYAAMMKGALLNKSESERLDWAARQVYLALGVLIAGAAVEGIDVGPMEGFDPARFDEILGLKEKGLSTKVIAAVGYRDDSDPYLQLKKVRFPLEDVLMRIV